MTRTLCCLDCGKTQLETFISKKLVCRRCAKKRAAEQVDRAFDLAEAMGARKTETFAEAVARSSQAIAETHRLAGLAREDRKAKRAKVRARLVRQGVLER